MYSGLDIIGPTISFESNEMKSFLKLFFVVRIALCPYRLSSYC